MLKEYISVFRKFMMLSDLCIVTVSFFLGYALRNLNPNFAPVGALLIYLPVMLLVWAALSHYFGMYESIRTMRMSQVVWSICKISGSGFIIFNTMLYLMKTPHLSRLFEVFVFLLASVFIGIERFFLISFFGYARKKGYNYRNILIIGTGKRARHFIELVKIHPEWGYRIIGLLDNDPAIVGEFIYDYKVIGTLADMPRITNDNVVDEVMFIVPRSWLDKIEDAMYFCETKGIRMHLAVDYFQLKLAKVKQSQLNGFPILTFETTPDKIWHLLIKRLIDLFLSIAACIICAPLFLIIALVIKTTSRGPVLFKQTRCGLNGRNFVFYKFRTMSLDAEERLKELLAYNEMNWPVFKMKKDPRLTPIGRFLRKTSLDELPQLWNVLKGDMSIVGPRPPIPTEVSEYESWHRRRLSMRPGITCLWQINGRNNICDFNRWVKFDLDYIDNWSLWLDCKIMLKTIPAVLTGIGAK